MHKPVRASSRADLHVKADGGPASDTGRGGESSEIREQNTFER